VCGIVEKFALGWDPRNRPMKQVALVFRRSDIIECGMGDALGIVMHGRRDAIECGVVRHRVIHDLLPPAKAHQHMHLHRVIAFHRDGDLRSRSARQNFLR